MGEQQENNQIISNLEAEAADLQASKESEAEALGEVKQALAAKTEEVQALHDKYLRLAAEFENYKRLAQREQRDYARFANEGILKDLFPVLDNLERAIRCCKEGQSTNGLIQGVELTLKHFHETLSKFGVRQVESIGVLFDPSRHQAVARVESASVPENTVVEEYQRGYLLHDRILRAAMVAVAVAPAPAAPEEGEAPPAAQEAPADAPN